MGDNRPDRRHAQLHDHRIDIYNHPGEHDNDSAAGNDHDGSCDDHDGSCDHYDVAWRSDTHHTAMCRPVAVARAWCVLRAVPDRGRVGVKRIWVQTAEAELLADSPRCPACGHLAVLHNIDYDCGGSDCWIDDCGCRHDVEDEIGPQPKVEPTDTPSWLGDYYYPPAWFREFNAEMVKWASSTA